MNFFSVMPNFKGVILNSFQDPEILTCVRMTKRKFGMTSDSGFTLIELLVVMIAFMVTGTVIASVIFTHVKAIDKTNTETNIRQIGNGIISQMSKDIRNAGAGMIDFQLAPGPDSTKAEACTAAGIDFPIMNTNPKVNPSNESSYLCDANNFLHLTKDGVVVSSDSLIDTDSIAIKNCTFTCQATSGSLPVITIKFTLEEKTTISTTKSKSIGQKVSIPFTTSIQMRNVQ